MILRKRGAATHYHKIMFDQLLYFIYIFTVEFVSSVSTVVPVMNGHPRDQAKVSVCRWPLIRGNLTLKCVGQGIDNVAVQGRWPLTTGVAQGRYYCTYLFIYLSYWAF